jgi:L-iditol 2-dehydrogenase
MHVIRLTGTRTFDIFDEPIPDITENQALLRIKAVGVCGSDLHRFRGHTFENDTNDGMVLGHEFSAVVEKIGKNVTSVNVGDRVAVEAADFCGSCEWCLKGYTNLCPHVRFCGLPGIEGALKEYMAWPAHLLFTLPDSLDYDDGVLAEGMGICLHSLDLSNVRPGQTAAVLGCGPIGLGMIELLRKVAGVSTIFATDIVPERLTLAKAFGADVLINPNEQDVAARINDNTRGRGVDCVFEAAGVDQTSEQMVDIAAPGGKVMIIGIPESGQIPFSPSPARRKGLTFRFVRRSLNTYERVLDMMDKNIIDVKKMVTHHFPLQQSQQAFELVDHYRDGAAKVIVTN